jgi:hypothetical protein
MDCYFYLDMLDYLIKKNLVVQFLVLLYCSLLFIYHSTIALEFLIIYNKLFMNL